MIRTTRAGQLETPLGRRAVLPAHIVSEVDWSSLRLEPGSVVDPELRETRARSFVDSTVSARAGLSSSSPDSAPA